jgi:hypothetical protein
MSSDQELRAVAERIEALVHGFAQSADPAARRDAQELVRLLMTLYGAGLERILRILELEERHGGRMVGALLADDLVVSLLVLHDLHPDDVATRIAHGLERLQSATTTQLTLLEVRDGAARVKAEPRHQGAPVTPIAVRRLIDHMVHAVAPDITRVDIEGEGLPVAGSPPLIQLTRPSPAQP